MCNYNILRSENEKALIPLLVYVAISNTCLGKIDPLYCLDFVQLCGQNLFFQNWTLPSRLSLVTIFTHNFELMLSLFMNNYHIY